MPYCKPNPIRIPSRPHLLFLFYPVPISPRSYSIFHAIPFHTISFHSPIPSRSHSTPPPLLPPTLADHDRNTHNALPPIPPHRRNGANPRLSRALAPASASQPPRRTYAQPAPMHLQRLHVRSRDQAGPVLRGVLGGHTVR